MRRALLIAALVALAAAAAHADIRRLMQAKGYSPGAFTTCQGNCGSNVTPQDTIIDQPALSSGCTFPATFPCTM